MMRGIVQRAVRSHLGLSIIGVACIGAACLATAALPASAEAEFGLLPGAAGFDGTVTKQDGTPATEAGSHPWAASTEINFNTTTNNVGELVPDGGSVKSVHVDLPPGFVGDPTATPVKCTYAELSLTTCPSDSQVGSGVIRFSFGFPFSLPLPVYNMVAQPGEAGAFGFRAFVVNQMLSARVRSDEDYGLTIDVTNINQGLALLGTSLTFWGVPADPSHDAERFCDGVAGCSTDAPLKPFLTNPTNCSTGPVTTSLATDSWDMPGDYTKASFISHDSSTPPVPVGPDACDVVPFEPEMTVSPVEQTADTPTALDVTLRVPQSENPDGTGSAHLKRAEVILPEGMTVSPSAAQGLEGCSPTEVGLISKVPVRFDRDKAACPPGSKIGSVEIISSLLEETIPGEIYLATQGQNPFDSLLAIYLVAHHDDRGLMFKLPGRIDADPNTGQLRTVFDNNPQLPFSEMRLRFNGGSRASLVTPPSCGEHEVRALLSPWSAVDPDNPTEDEIVTSRSSFEITSGPGGTPCAETKEERPFSPAMNAGVENASADAYSPFVLNLTRPDGHQELSSLNLQMPEGVTAKLAGVAYCPDNVLAQISQAEGTGAAEDASPSCPSSSQVGEATVGAGAGSNPYYVQTGKAYLAGPYKGAPLSLAVVVPALAGPFDLGTTVVRNKLVVDKRTAQVSVESDPLPQILHGIPLKLRDIRVNVNREGFMKAPTNCDPMTVNAQIQGSHGKSAALTNRFQVGDCASLGFNPKLRLDFGKSRKNTKRNAHPELNAKLSFNEGDANISSVEVALPQGVFLDQARLGRICSRANYAAETCPEESKVGYAKATTPLLDAPVEGPVYLKASDNPLPDLAADLNGQIDIDLFGRIDQKENRRGVNQIRNTFDVVPDVPVSDFQLTLDGGADGLLVNSQNICKTKRAQRVSIDMQAHNEMSLSERPLVGSACKQINKKKAKRLKKKAKKLQRKAKQTRKKARKASGKKATKLLRKSKKLKKKAKQAKQQARKLR